MKRNFLIISMLLILSFFLSGCFAGMSKYVPATTNYETTYKMTPIYDENNKRAGTIITNKFQTRVYDKNNKLQYKIYH